MVSSPLVFASNTFTIDYEDLERKTADPKVKVMLLCNPHNPAGRVWKREELVRIGEICIRHDVTVVSMRFIANWFFQSTVTHRLLPSQKISVTIL